MRALLILTALLAAAAVGHGQGWGILWPARNHGGRHQANNQWFHAREPVQSVAPRRGRGPARGRGSAHGRNPAHQECTTLDGLDGMCRRATNCPPERRRLTTEITVCRRRGHYRKICCPFPIRNHNNNRHLPDPSFASVEEPSVGDGGWGGRRQGDRGGQLWHDFSDALGFERDPIDSKPVHDIGGVAVDDDSFGSTLSDDDVDKDDSSYHYSDVVDDYGGTGPSDELLPSGSDNDRFPVSGSRGDFRGADSFDDDSANDGFFGTGPTDGDFAASRPTNDGFAASRPTNDGFAASRPTNDGFAASRPTNDGFSETGPTDDGFATSYPTDDGFDETGPIDDRFAGTGPADDGFAASRPTNDGFAASRPTNDGFATSRPTNDGLAASRPTNDGFATSHPTNDGFAASRPTNDGFAASRPTNDGFAASRPTDDGFAGTGLTDDGFAASGSTGECGQPTPKSVWIEAGQMRSEPKLLFDIRVVGGKNAEIGKWPWIALIGDKQDGKPPSFFCGGTLIDGRNVLTAAHCLKARAVNVKSLVVRLGEYDTSSNEDGANPKDYRVASFSNHENFRFPVLHDDISVVHLDGPVEFTGAIKPICLPSGPDGDHAGTGGDVAGWGHTQFDGEASNILQEITLPLRSIPKCQAVYASQRAFSIQFPSGFGDTKLCAGGEVEGGRDACQGDSGGPMMRKLEDGRYELIGVVSAGAGCGKPEYPGIYTRVSAYLDWIQQNKK